MISRRLASSTAFTVLHSKEGAQPRDRTRKDGRKVHLSDLDTGLVTGLAVPKDGMMLNQYALQSTRSRKQGGCGFAISMQCDLPLISNGF